MKNLWFFSILALCIAGSIYWYSRRSPVPPSNQPRAGWLVVIPGITGDLAKRKLIPALYRLYKKGIQGTIIGTGRRDADIRAILAEAQKFIDDFDAHVWHEFSQRVMYQRLDPKSSSDFKALAQIITEHEAVQKLSGKRLIYLSLPADVFCPMTRLFVESGIVVPHKDHFILFEKPFGWDLSSAREINACLTSLLPERQIYRVDHYVAKGLTQSLPYLSETNAVLTDIWNGKSIASVSILFHEKIDIESRGQFYDRFGAIKDVVQNHVLQLLAYFGSDLSHAKTSQERADQKAEFLSSLSVKEVHKGQYEGYKAEKDVSPTSTTETYAAITLESNDQRWKGVRFFVEAGKALAEKNTQLSVRFKPVKTHSNNQVAPPNELVIQFAPKESILLHVNGLNAQPIELKESSLKYTEAYEALLEDVFMEKLRYNVSFKEIEEQWRLADSMLAFKTPLKTYPKGFKPHASP